MKGRLSACDYNNLLCRTVDSAGHTDVFRYCLPEWRIAGVLTMSQKVLCPAPRVLREQLGQTE